VILMLLLAGLLPAIASSTTGAERVAPRGAVRQPSPCGKALAAPTSIDHVVWIWMENENYGSVVGSSDAPFQTSLARECGVALNYQAISHPSLPNYLAASGGSTFGVSDDAEPALHPIHAPSIFSEVTSASESWRAYVESMPVACDQVTSGEYAARHNPAVYFVLLRKQCEFDVVALGPISTGGFAVAARSGRLPNFSFVVPNICDDAHSCSVAHGDAWLARFLPELFSAPQYRAGSVALFLTYDEGSGDNHVPMIVAAARVKSGTASRVLFDHYSLLRTTETLLGLPLLGAAKHASAMISSFDL
jgi:phospholipase C